MPPQPAENEHVHYDGDDQEETGQTLEDDEAPRPAQTSDHASNDEDDVTVLSGPIAEEAKVSRSSQGREEDTDMRAEGAAATGPAERGSTLYVRNLPTHMLSDHVRTYFSRHGDVIDCRIVINPVTKESRGFGFVSYRTAEMADRAMSAMDQMDLEGRILRIEKARRNKPHDPTPGQYKGPTAASIKYDNRGRLKPGYVPYWDLPVPRSGGQGSAPFNRGIGRRETPPPRRSFSRDERSSAHGGRYYGGSGHNPPRYSGYSSPRARPMDSDRVAVHRASPRRPVSPSWERGRYYTSNSYEQPSRDRPEFVPRPYSSSSYYAGSGGSSGGGYYSVNDTRAAARGSNGRVSSSYGYRDPPPAYESGQRRASIVPNRYDRAPIPAPSGSSRRDSSGYYNSISAEPSSRPLHRPSGRSRSPLRGIPPSHPSPSRHRDSSFTPRQRSSSTARAAYSYREAGYSSRW